MLAVILTALALFLVPFAYLLITDYIYKKRLMRESLVREEIKKEYAKLLRHERMMRSAYEQALGLPTWDDGELEKALWARAYQDQEDPAWQILSVIYSESSFEDWVYDR